MIDINLIPYGKQNAIKRSRLADLWKCSDREMRQAVAKLRKDEPILNLQDGSGYFRPTQEELGEVKSFLAQEIHRAKSIQDSVKGLLVWLEKEKADGRC